MSMALLRKTVGAARRALRLRLFGNNQPIVVNLNHRRYHARARRLWAQVKAPSTSPDIRMRHDELRREGYVQLSPGASRELLDTIHDAADRLFAVPEFCTTPIEGAIRLKDGIRRISELTGLLTPEIVQIVENYYGSYFKIYWAQAYRTLPTDKDADASFLWHVDNCPPQVVKLMVYLTDTRENTGAFRLKPRPLSTQMLRQGFFDRSKNHRFARLLEDASTTRVFEGPKGTSILFLNWACVHRAKHPEVGHLDVVVFFLVPSLVPWHQHLKENVENLSLREDVCPDPAIA